MIPATFDYLRPERLSEALNALAAGGDDAVVLAGGQSLMTDLKLRRRRPGLVVDISGLGVTAVAVTPSGLSLGAMARQANVAASPAAAAWPLLAQTAAAAADPMVRRRGTVVGGFCEAEAGGDWAAAGLALDARLDLASLDSHRTAALADLIPGPGRARLAPGEIALEAKLPSLPRGAVTRYAKAKHAAIGWSIASAAVVLVPGDRGCTLARIAVAGAVSHPQRLHGLEAVLPSLDFADSAGLDRVIGEALAGLALRGDAYASAEYRAARLALLLRRTLTEMAGRISAS